MRFVVHNLTNATATKRDSPLQTAMFPITEEIWTYQVCGIYVVINVTQGYIARELAARVEIWEANPPSSAFVFENVTESDGNTSEI